MANSLNLSKLPAIVERRKKRIGRGHGSGKVKTGGRGTKGQKSRGTMKIGFEGGQLPLITRLPLLRGKLRNKSINDKRVGKATPVTVNKLNLITKENTVTIENLIKFNIIDKSSQAVKILGKGKLDRAYKVKVACSNSARLAIEKAGGSVQ
jgi:large subunit ribosomal protein L15